MERIETGTTRERRTRILLLAGLWILFAAWFGYDGRVKYPAKNLEWATQKLPSHLAVEGITANPNVTEKNLAVFKHKVEKESATFSREELVELLGEPAAEDPEKGDMYFIGPAVYFRVKLTDGQFRYLDPVQWQDDVDDEKSPLHDEANLKTQRNYSVGLVVAAIVTLAYLAYVLRTRVVLDDDGLDYNGNRIPWDAMTSLDASRYATKGFVDLTYQRGNAQATLRLDNYKIDAFRPILTAICDRKGFGNFFAEDADDTSADSTQSG